MFIRLLKYKSPLFWVGFHVLLGILAALTPYPLIGYFYFALGSAVWLLFKRSRKARQPLIASNKNNLLAPLLAYFTSFELLARMAKTSPFLPWELGKYLLFFLLIIGIISGRKSSKTGALLVVLLIPALLYDLSGLVTFQDLRFNLMGPISLGLAVWFFSGKRFTPQGLGRLLTVMLLPLISALAYTLFRSPDLDSYEFNLLGNAALSGGFGPNQVSTAFGLGTFLSFYMWLNRMTLTGKRWLDLGIVLAFTFQGLFSFSRGGMLGGILGILVVLYFTFFGSDKSIISHLMVKRIKRYLPWAVVALLIAIFSANMITDGKLLLRYQGETPGTLSGQRERTLNTMTTDRIAVMQGDIALFADHLAFGVGVGASKYLRPYRPGLVAHTETTRLLADHGILGVAYILCIIYLIIHVYKSPNERQFKALLLGFILIGWYTTFHAATRTYITPLLIGLSLIYIRHARPSLPG